MPKRNFTLIGLIILIIIVGYFLFQNEKNSMASEDLKPRDIIISKETSISSNSLKTLIKKAINNQYTGNVTNIKITEVLNIEDGTFVSFLLEEGNYYGVLYSTKKNEDYVLNTIEIYKTNKKEKLNVSQLIGNTNEVPKRKYRIISGIINGKMDTVDIFYQDGEYFIIKLDNTKKTFMNINVGNAVPPTKISGKLQDKEIFSITYSK